MAFGWVVSWVGLWVQSFQFAMGWVALGQSFGGLGWVEETGPTNNSGLSGKTGLRNDVLYVEQDIKTLLSRSVARSILHVVIKCNLMTMLCSMASSLPSVGSGLMSSVKAFIIKVAIVMSRFRTIRRRLDMTLQHVLSITRGVGWSL